MTAFTSASLVTLTAASDISSTTEAARLTSPLVALQRSCTASLSFPTVPLAPSPCDRIGSAFSYVSIADPALALERDVDGHLLGKAAVGIAHRDGAAAAVAVDLAHAGLLAAQGTTLHTEDTVLNDRHAVA